MILCLFHLINSRKIKSRLNFFFYDDFSMNAIITRIAIIILASASKFHTYRLTTSYYYIDYRRCRTTTIVFKIRCVCDTMSIFIIIFPSDRIANMDYCCIRLNTRIVEKSWFRQKIKPAKRMESDGR